MNWSAGEMLPTTQFELTGSTETCFSKMAIQCAFLFQLVVYCWIPNWFFFSVFRTHQNIPFYAEFIYLSHFFVQFYHQNLQTVLVIIFKDSVLKEDHIGTHNGPVSTLCTVLSRERYFFTSSIIVFTRTIKNSYCHDKCAANFMENSSWKMIITLEISLDNLNVSLISCSGDWDHFMNTFTGTVTSFVSVWHLFPFNTTNK